MGFPSGTRTVSHVRAKGGGMTSRGTASTAAVVLHPEGEARAHFGNDPKTNPAKFNSPLVIMAQIEERLNTVLLRWQMNIGRVVTSTLRERSFIRAGANAAPPRLTRSTRTGIADSEMAG
jgi:hypothetical protein